MDSVKDGDVVVTKAGNTMTVAEYEAWRNQKNADWYARNEAILKRYEDLIAKRGENGERIHTEESAMAVIREAFGLKTNRAIRNVLTKAASIAAPELRTIAQASVLRRLDRLDENAGDAEAHADSVLDYLDKLEACGKKWIEIEETDGVGRNGGAVTKKITLEEARRRWHREKMDANERWFGAVKTFVPQTVLQQTIDKGDVYNQYSMGDLERQIAEEEKKLKVNNEKGEDRGA